MRYIDNRRSNAVLPFVPPGFDGNEQSSLMMNFEVVEFPEQKRNGKEVEKIKKIELEMRKSKFNVENSVEN